MPNTITLLASTTVTATPVTVISFTSIPQTYTDLMIMTSCRTTDTINSNYASDVLIVFNSTTSGYQNYFSRNNTSTLNAFTSTPSTSANGLLGSGRNATANTYAGGTMYIPNYTTSLNKNFYAHTAIESNNASYDSANLAVGGTWNNSAAITRIDCTDGYGGYAIGSMINLYGIIKS
jgi:hypothetical protein